MVGGWAVGAMQPQVAVAAEGRVAEGVGSEGTWLHACMAWAR